MSLNPIPSITFSSATLQNNPDPNFPNARLQPLRKTRIVCISDTHNRNPLTGDFKVPEGDVLIHAGDITNSGTLGELEKAVKWLETLEHEVKIVIAGNHDDILDPTHPEYPSAMQLMESAAAKGVVYMPAPYSSDRITLLRGPQTSFTIFACPLTPSTDKHRALTYHPDSPPWDNIPPGTDIVITHVPARYHLDFSSGSNFFPAGFTGCEQLRRALWAIRPALHVCGHVHESRGAELVRWDIIPEYRVIWREISTRRWEGDSVRKLCKVDLVNGEWGLLQRGRETCFVNASIMKRGWSKLQGHGTDRGNGIVVIMDARVLREEVVSTLTADESERMEVVKRIRRRSTMKERVERMMLSVAFAGLVVRATGKRGKKGSRGSRGSKEVMNGDGVEDELD